MKNKKYKFNPPDGHTAKLVSQEELEKAREEATKLTSNGKDKIAMRSCWRCNGSHAYLLDGAIDGVVIRCFICGRFYYKNIDITLYE